MRMRTSVKLYRQTQNITCLRALYSSCLFKTNLLIVANCWLNYKAKSCRAREGLLHVVTNITRLCARTRPYSGTISRASEMRVSE